MDFVELEFRESTGSGWSLLCAVWHLSLKAGGWSYLQAPSLICLMRDAGWWLGTELRLLAGTPTHGLWLLLSMEAGSKGSVPRERAQWKLCHRLWLSLGNHSVTSTIFHWQSSYRALPRLKGTGPRCLLREQCWCHTERRVHEMGYMLVWPSLQNIICHTICQVA